MSDGKHRIGIAAALKATQPSVEDKAEWERENAEAATKREKLEQEWSRKFWDDRRKPLLAKMDDARKARLAKGITDAASVERTRNRLAAYSSPDPGL